MPNLVFKEMLAVFQIMQLYEKKFSSFGKAYTTTILSIKCHFFVSKKMQHNKTIAARIKLPLPLSFYRQSTLFESRDNTKTVDFIKTK